MDPKATTEIGMTTNAYTDVQSLQNLASRAKTHKQEVLKEMAQQFESIFLQMTLKSMRDANNVFKSDLTSGHQTEFYRDLHDRQLAVYLSKSGVGLADKFYEHLQRLNQRTHPTSSSDTTQRPTQTAKTNHPSITKATTTTTVTDRQELPLPFKGDDLFPKLIRSDLPKPFVDHQQLRKLGAYANNQHSTQTPTAEQVKSKQGFFKNKVEFVKTLWREAKIAGGLIGVDPKVLVAQAALETAWGKKVIQHNDGSNTHNLFAIKASKSWDKAKAFITTTEFRNGVAKKETAPFRSYGSYSESFQDYVSLLMNNPRYQSAVEKASDAKAFIKAIHDAGYATDPNYAKKIIRILDSEVFNSLP